MPTFFENIFSVKSVETGRCLIGSEIEMWGLREEK
jgi:hypothetical protein